MELLSLLNNRYATKRMTGEKVDADKVAHILEAIRLSASSIGLQPYTIFVIEDEALRKQIFPIANNQPQIVECSHLLVFAVWDKLTPNRIDEILNYTIEKRGPSERTENFRKSLHKRSVEMPEEKQFNWNARQAYIALGTGLIAAAAEGVDATPMEGFNSDQLDELLKLNEQGLKSVLLMPIGYRDVQNDFLVNLPKVRRSSEKLFVKI